FVVTPGTVTAVDVQLVLFRREEMVVLAANAGARSVRTIGLAPLTSMFWFGENSERRFDDYRPEVHDSDGLLEQGGDGQWIWRPLRNGTASRHLRPPGNGIRGFGLMQRDRDLTSYQDAARMPQRMPNIWVEPRGDWGQGTLHLVELATAGESMDN